MEIFKETVTWLDTITIIFSFITMIATIWNLIVGYKRNQKLEQDIKIILTCGAERKLLPHTIKRRHFTRSEIQGILGNCYNDNKRYNISYLSKEDYSNLIRDIQNGDFDTLIIPIEERGEFDKFLISSTKE